MDENQRRPVGRHTLTDADRQRIREEAEAAYRAEVEAQLRTTAPEVPPVEVPAPGVTPSAPAEKPKPEWMVRAEEQQARDAARRAALTPEQRQREDRRNSVITWVTAGVIGVTGIIVFQACGQQFAQDRAAKRNARDQAAAAALTVAGQEPYLIREVCLDAVRGKLKAPSSARFEDREVPMLSGGQWNWVSYVDAQNSFGAQIRSNFTCEVFGDSWAEAKVRAVILE